MNIQELKSFALLLDIRFNCYERKSLDYGVVIFFKDERFISLNAKNFITVFSFDENMTSSEFVEHCGLNDYSSKSIVRISDNQILYVHDDYAVIRDIADIFYIEVDCIKSKNDNNIVTTRL